MQSKCSYPNKEELNAQNPKWGVLFQEANRGQDVRHLRLRGSIQGANSKPSSSGPCLQEISREGALQLLRTTEQKMGVQHYREHGKKWKNSAESHCGQRPFYRMPTAPCKQGIHYENPCPDGKKGR